MEPASTAAVAPLAGGVPGAAPASGREFAWDFNRELRALRDNAARSRADEVQALRRQNEEVDRCALRRQLDESAALEDFLGGFHRDMGCRLERLRVDTLRHLETLEERISKVENEAAALAAAAPEPGAAGTAAAVKSEEVSAEVQRALREAIFRVERSAAAAAAVAAEKSCSPRVHRGTRMRAPGLASGRGAGWRGGGGSYEVAGDMAEDDQLQGSFAEDGDDDRDSDDEPEALGTWLDSQRRPPTSSCASSCSGLEGGSRRGEREPSAGSRLDRLGLRLVAAAETSAREAAREATSEVTEVLSSRLAELRQQVVIEVEFCRAQAEGAAEAAAGVAAEGEAASAGAAAAEAAAAAVRGPLLSELAATLRAELAEEAVQAAESAALEPMRALKAGLAATEARAEGLASELSPRIRAAEEQLSVDIQRAEGLARSAVEEGKAAAAEAFRAASGCFSEEFSALEEELSACEQDLRTAIREQSLECLEACDRASKELAVELRAQATADGGEELRLHLDSKCKALAAELTVEDQRVKDLAEEALQEAQQAHQAALRAWKPEAAALSNEASALSDEVQELRRELQATISQASSAVRSVGSLQAESSRLASSVRDLQRQGASHEWQITKCLQRLQYLSMDDAGSQGVWIDSPEFQLEGLNQTLVLRLYPRGASGGDGTCAVGLLASESSEQQALPLRLDLSVAGLRKRAFARSEASGLLWLAVGFGHLEELLADQEDLPIGVEIPPFAWASLQKPEQEPPRVDITLGNSNLAATFSTNNFGTVGGAGNSAPSMESSSLQSQLRTRPSSAGSTGRHRSSLGASPLLPGACSAAPAASSPFSSPGVGSRPGWAVFGSKSAGGDVPGAQAASTGAAAAMDRSSDADRRRPASAHSSRMPGTQALLASPTQASPNRTLLAPEAPGGPPAGRTRRPSGTTGTNPFAAPAASIVPALPGSSASQTAGATERRMSTNPFDK